MVSFTSRIQKRSVPDVPNPPTCGPYANVTVTGATSGGAVYGVNPYTEDSDFAVAAVHAGLLSAGQTGEIRRVAAGYRNDFTGNANNSVTTLAYNQNKCGVQISLISAEPPPPPPPPFTGIALPDGAVLFGYNKRYDDDLYLKNTTVSYSGSYKLNNFFRKFTEAISPNLPNPPCHFIRNWSTNTNWNRTSPTNANTVIGSTQATASYTLSGVTTQVPIPLYGNILDGNIGGTDWLFDYDQYTLSGRHGYLSPHPIGSYDMDHPARPATDIPKILGFAAGDTAHPTERYAIHNRAHEGHNHIVTGFSISEAVTGIQFGRDTSTASSTSFVTGGLNLLPVIPLYKDPKLQGSSTTPITSLPKGVLVFGEDLAADSSITLWTRDQYDPTGVPTTEDYTRHDYDHEAGVSTKGESASSDNSFSGDNPNTFADVPLFLTTRNTDTGVLAPSFSKFTVTAISNNSGIHNHKSLTTAAKSNRTNQTADAFGDSGLHNHPVDYTGTIQIKSKVLNGWITLKDETPLANGMIIGFSPPALYNSSTVSASDLAKTAEDWLPPYWHFCDGTNGTPDLRGYGVSVNMYESVSNHGVVLYSTNQINFSEILTSPSSGEVNVLFNEPPGFVNVPRQTHTHVIGTETGIGTPISVKGTHGTNTERWHTHRLKAGTTFVEPFNKPPGSTSTSTSFTYQNIRTGVNYNYNPPTVFMAFIMLNKAVP